MEQKESNAVNKNDTGRLPIIVVDQYAEAGFDIDPSSSQTLGQTLTGDVYFVLGDNVFQAPKWRITAKSTFFASLFVHKPGNRYYVRNISERIFKSIFDFILTKKIELSNVQFATEVLILAAKFEIEQLKIICQDYLIKAEGFLNNYSIIDILILADRTNSSLLRSNAIEFIKSSVYAGSYDDVRCKCLCPLTGVVTNGTNPSNRKMYIGNVPPNQCNCDFVVLPSLDDNVQAKAKEFCPRCECKYESRNTATIRFFVIFIIGMISFLVIYMAFLIILEPWMHRRSIFTSYKHFNEEVSMQEQHSTDDAQLTGTRRRAPTSSSLSQDEGENDDQVPKGMFNRVGHSQSRWKQKVNQQRKNIYDDHTMLN